jgi:hypothetical protein
MCMSQPRHGTVFKCGLVLLAGLLVGLVVSIMGIVVAGRVNEWDDAPGAGIFALVAMLVGVAVGVAGGLLVLESIWKNHTRNYVWRTAKGSILLVCAIAMVLPVLIMPMDWSRLASSQRVLSIGVTAALAVIDLVLFLLSASYLGNSREGSEQSET